MKMDTSKSELPGSDALYDPKFGQFSSPNGNQILYGIKCYVKSLFVPKQEEISTFKDLTHEEIINEKFNSKHAMIGTTIEFFLGIFAIFAILLFVPGILDFLIYQFNQAGTKVISWVILGLFTVGLSMVVRTMIHINYEYSNLVRVFIQSRVISLKGMSRIPFRYLMPPAHSGMVYRKLDAIFRIAKDNGTVPHKALSDVLFTRQLLEDEVPFFLANSMTMVGLVGTIIGLTGATNGMETLFGSVGDLSQLKLGFMDTLSGIDTAFFTTLLGAAGMIVLKYFNIIAKKARIIFLTELEQVVITEILPKIPRISFSDNSYSVRKPISKEAHDYGEKEPIADLDDDISLSFPLENKVEVRPVSKKVPTTRSKSTKSSVGRNSKGRITNRKPSKDLLALALASPSPIKRKRVIKHSGKSSVESPIKSKKSSKNSKKIRLSHEDFSELQDGEFIEIKIKDPNSNKTTIEKFRLVSKD